MNWQHLAQIALGASMVVTGILIPATAVYLIPVGSGLLLVSDIRKAAGKKDNKHE
jgi:hypothetical protein